MDRELSRDLDGLCSKTIEYGLEGFVKYLIEEPAALEEGFVTEEDIKLLSLERNNEFWKVINKATSNRGCLHSYAEASRLMGWLKSNE